MTCNAWFLKFPGFDFMWGKQIKTIFVGLFVLMTNTAHAALYQCITDGRISYQEQPCKKSDAEIKPDSNIGRSMTGCYDVPHEGKVQKLEIANMGGDKYLLYFLSEDPGKRDGFSMKRASQADLKKMEAAKPKEEKIEFSDGVILAKDIGKDSAIGIFKVKEKGKEIYLTIWPYLTGVSKRVPCQ